MNKTAVYQDKKLSYAIHGSGPAVVFVHGFGEDGRVWKNQVPFFEKDFQLIIPHLPGSGSSELIDDMSIEGMAESIHFILLQEGIEKCSVIGHSMGGYITLAFAEKHSSLLNSFGLFHSTAFPDTEEKKKIRREGIEFIKEKGAFEFLKNATPNLYSSYIKTSNSPIIDQHIESIKYFSSEALIAYYTAMINRPDRTHVLKQNNLPILFVLGKEDKAVPLQDGLRQAHMPNISYVHILEQSAHMGMYEEPEKSNRILKDFLWKTI